MSIFRRPPLQESSTVGTPQVRGQVRWFGLCLYLFTLSLDTFLFVTLVIWSNNWGDHNMALFTHTPLPFLLPVMEIWFFLCCLFFVYMGTLAAFSISQMNKDPGLQLEFRPEHMIILCIMCFLLLTWFTCYSFIWTEEWNLVWRFSEISFPIIQGIAILFLVPISFPLFRLLWKSDSKQIMIIRILICFIYLFIFTIPMWGTSIHILDGPLPPKPLIIGHRGAPTEVPENTLLSFKTAMDIGVDIGPFSNHKPSFPFFLIFGR